MKTTLSLKTIAFFILAALLFAAPSCTGDKDPDSKTLCELIEGEWEVTAYIVDGEDLLDDPVLDGIVMEFEDNDCEGDLNWTFDFSDGTNSDASDEYSIDEEDEEITIGSPGSPDEATFDLEIDEDDLEISGTVDGTSISIKAERQ